MENLNYVNISSLFKAFCISFLSEFGNVLGNLRWLLFCGVVLIICDLWFGVNDNVGIKHQEFRFSKMGRRTFNKTIDYLCYILIGVTLAKGIAEPYGINTYLVAITIIFICYGFEIDSIYGHICSLHGITPRYSIWELIGMLITFRWGKLYSQILDIQQQYTVNKKHKKRRKSYE